MGDLWTTDRFQKGETAMNIVGQDDYKSEGGGGETRTNLPNIIKGGGPTQSRSGQKGKKKKRLCEPTFPIRGGK